MVRIALRPGYLEDARHEGSSSCRCQRKDREDEEEIALHGCKFRARKDAEIDPLLGTQFTSLDRLGAGKSISLRVKNWRFVSL